MKILLTLVILLTASAYGAADIVDLTEGPPGTKPKIVEERNYVCLTAEGVKIELVPRAGESRSDRLERAGELIGILYKRIKAEEKAEDKKIKRFLEFKKEKLPAPNAKPIPKTTSNEATWYSERTDDLVMYCPLPK